MSFTGRNANGGYSFLSFWCWGSGLHPQNWVVVWLCLYPQELGWFPYLSSSCCCSAFLVVGVQFCNRLDQLLAASLSICDLTSHLPRKKGLDGCLQVHSWTLLESYCVWELFTSAVLDVIVVDWIMLPLWSSIGASQERDECIICLNNFGILPALQRFNQYGISIDLMGFPDSIW